MGQFHVLQAAVLENLHIVTESVIVAVFVLDTLFPEPINGIRISHSHKWPGGLREFGVRLLDSVSSDGVFEGEINDTADEML